MPSSKKNSDIQYKAAPQGMVNLDEAEGIVECFVAGIGNKDSVGDVCAPGAFGKSLIRRKPRVVWGHNWNDPIGKVLDMYEVPPSDPRLPGKMKAAGIGGLYARVQFNLKSEKGREAFANVAFFGEEQEWSIGYKTINAKFDPQMQANILYEVELYEVSPVLHGANQLTGTISIKSEDQSSSVLVNEQPTIDGLNINELSSVLDALKTMAAATDEKCGPAMPMGMPSGGPGMPSAPKPMQTQAPRDAVKPEVPSMPENPMLVAIRRELVARTGANIIVRSAAENNVVFDRITSDGVSSTYRLPYHFMNGEFMFGKPEKINMQMNPESSVPDMPGAMPQVAGYSNPDMFDAGKSLISLDDTTWGEGFGQQIPAQQVDVSTLNSVISNLEKIIEEKSTYLIPVDIEDAFQVKQAIDPILDFYRVDATVTEEGIIVKSLDSEFLDAMDVATKGIFRSIGNMVDRAVDRPNIGGGNRRNRTPNLASRGPGIGSRGAVVRLSDGTMWDPKNAPDRNNNGIVGEGLFDGRGMSLSQPDPTPSGPDSIDAPKTPKPPKAPKEATRLSSGRGDAEYARELAKQREADRARGENATNPIGKQPAPKKETIDTGSNINLADMTPEEAADYAAWQDEETWRDRDDRFSSGLLQTVADNPALTGLLAGYIWAKADRRNRDDSYDDSEDGDGGVERFSSGKLLLTDQQVANIEKRLAALEAALESGDEEAQKELLKKIFKGKGYYEPSVREQFGIMVQDNKFRTLGRDGNSPDAPDKEITDEDLTNFIKTKYESDAYDSIASGVEPEDWNDEDGLSWEQEQEGLPYIDLYDRAIEKLEEENVDETSYDTPSTIEEIADILGSEELLLNEVENQIFARKQKLENNKKAQRLSSGMDFDKKGASGLREMRHAERNPLRYDLPEEKAARDAYEEIVANFIKNNGWFVEVPMYNGDPKWQSEDWYRAREFATNVAKLRFEDDYLNDQFMQFFNKPGKPSKKDFFAKKGTVDYKSWYMAKTPQITSDIDNVINSDQYSDNFKESYMNAVRSFLYVNRPEFGPYGGDDPAYQAWLQQAGLGWGGRYSNSGPSLDEMPRLSSGATRGSKKDNFIRSYDNPEDLKEAMFSHLIANNINDYEDMTAEDLADALNVRAQHIEPLLDAVKKDVGESIDDYELYASMRPEMTDAEMEAMAQDFARAQTVTDRFADMTPEEAADYAAYMDEETWRDRLSSGAKGNTPEERISNFYNDMAEQTTAFTQDLANGDARLFGDMSDTEQLAVFNGIKERLSDNNPSMVGVLEDGGLDIDGYLQEFPQLHPDSPSSGNQRLSSGHGSRPRGKTVKYGFVEDKSPRHIKKDGKWVQVDDGQKLFVDIYDRFEGGRDQRITIDELRDENGIPNGKFALGRLVWDDYEGYYDDEPDWDIGGELSDEDFDSIDSAMEFARDWARERGQFFGASNEEMDDPFWWDSSVTPETARAAWDADFERYMARRDAESEAWRAANPDGDRFSSGRSKARGNRGDGKGKGTAWSAEDRRRFADGDILRAQTRPGKRRQGPSASEFSSDNRLSSGRRLSDGPPDSWYDPPSDPNEQIWDQAGDMSLVEINDTFDGSVSEFIGEMIGNELYAEDVTADAPALMHIAENWSELVDMHVGDIERRRAAIDTRFTRDDERTLAAKQRALDSIERDSKAIDALRSIEKLSSEERVQLFRDMENGNATKLISAEDLASINESRFDVNDLINNDKFLESLDDKSPLGNAVLSNFDTDTVAEWLIDKQNSYDGYDDDRFSSGARFAPEGESGSRLQRRLSSGEVKGPPPTGSDKYNREEQVGATMRTYHSDPSTAIIPSEATGILGDVPSGKESHVLNTAAAEKIIANPDMEYSADNGWPVDAGKLLDFIEVDDDDAIRTLREIGDAQRIATILGIPESSAKDMLDGKPVYIGSGTAADMFDKLSRNKQYDQSVGGLNDVARVWGFDGAPKWVRHSDVATPEFDLDENDMVTWSDVKWEGLSRAEFDAEVKRKKNPPEPVYTSPVEFFNGDAVASNPKWDARAGSFKNPTVDSEFIAAPKKLSRSEQLEPTRMPSQARVGQTTARADKEFAKEWIKRAHGVSAANMMDILGIQRDSEGENVTNAEVKKLLVALNEIREKAGLKTIGNDGVFRDQTVVDAKRMAIPDEVMHALITSGKFKNMKEALASLGDPRLDSLAAEYDSRMLVDAALIRIKDKMNKDGVAGASKIITDAMTTAFGRNPDKQKRVIEGRVSIVGDMKEDGMIGNDKISEVLSLVNEKLTQAGYPEISQDELFPKDETGGYINNFSSAVPGSPRMSSGQRFVARSSSSRRADAMNDAAARREGNVARLSSGSIESMPAFRDADGKLNPTNMRDAAVSATIPEGLSARNTPGQNVENFEKAVKVRAEIAKTFNMNTEKISGFTVYDLEDEMKKAGIPEDEAAELVDKLVELDDYIDSVEDMFSEARDTMDAAIEEAEDSMDKIEKLRKERADIIKRYGEDDGQPLIEAIDEKISKAVKNLDDAYQRGIGNENARMGTLYSQVDDILGSNQGWREHRPFNTNTNEKLAALEAAITKAGGAKKAVPVTGIDFGVPEGTRLSSGKADEYYQNLTSHLINMIEKSQKEGGKWDAPWHRAGNIPRNASTKNMYSGGNLFALMLAAEEKGYTTPQWAGFQQWKKLGGSVKKGEKATIILIPRQMFGDEIDPDTGQKVRKSKGTFFSTAHVFNFDQIEGIDREEFLKTPTDALTPEQRVGKLEDAIKEIGATIKTGDGSRAYYSPSEDHVVMPPFELFKSPEGYYGTLAHELVHWTGHSSRLDRKNMNQFGSPDYAREELVAEFGSAFLLAMFDLSSEPREDHAHYLASWLKVLREEPNALQEASIKAQAASKLLIEKMKAVLEEMGEATSDAESAVDVKSLQIFNDPLYEVKDAYIEWSSDPFNAPFLVKSLDDKKHSSGLVNRSWERIAETAIFLERLSKRKK